MVKKKKRSKLKIDDHRLQEIYGIILVAVSLLLALFMFSEVTGVVGKITTDIFKYLVGSIRYLVPFLLLAWGISYLAHKPEINVESVGLGLLICFLSLGAFVHITALFTLGFSFQDIFNVEFLISYGGGYIGAFLAYILWLLVRSGAYIVLIAAFLIGLVLCTGISISTVTLRIANFFKNIFGKSKPEEAIKEKAKVSQRPTIQQTRDEIYQTQKLEVPQEQVTAAAAQAAEKESDRLKLDEKLAKAKGYELPPLEILKTVSAHKDLLSKKGVKESIQILEKTLHDFRVDAKIGQVTQGPTVTRFEIEPSAGVKVNQVLSLADDIALALASPDVRILTPVPSRSAIGVEVPNKYRELVTLGDVLRTEAAHKTKGPLIFGLGKDVSGKPVLPNLGEMPHLLIAGATGSGKSVCLNSLLTSVFMRTHPEQVKLILIDPKRIEFNLYKDVPHLLTPVVINPKQAATVLTWAVEEMEKRFGALAEVESRNIDTYNAAIRKNGNDKEHEHMPYIIIVIDELADLMIIAPSEVEDTICRIAQMARAVGIHLVVATQRPSADIITGLIKANITSRIAFAVSSQTDSRVILDTGGAEKLVGKGDMLFSTPQGLKPRRIQGSFITEQEVMLITDFAKKQAKPEYDGDIFSKERASLRRFAQEDELVDDAMELVVSLGHASVSMLQRKLRVGYSRAARLMDILEEKGVVGEYEGSKPREVLITPEELHQIREGDPAPG